MLYKISGRGGPLDAMSNNQTVSWNSDEIVIYDNETEVSMVFRDPKALGCI